MTIRAGTRTGYVYKLDEFDKVMFESIEEAQEGYDVCIQQLLDQPRFFLDNLDRIKEFKVPWLNYGSKDYCRRHKRNYAISHPRDCDAL